MEGDRPTDYIRDCELALDRKARDKILWLLTLLYGLFYFYY
jgi:hypothetical protein